MAQDVAGQRSPPKQPTSNQPIFYHNSKHRCVPFLSSSSISLTNQTGSSPLTRLVYALHLVNLLFSSLSLLDVFVSAPLSATYIYSHGDCFG